MGIDYIAKMNFLEYKEYSEKQHEELNKEALAVKQKNRQEFWNFIRNINVFFSKCVKFQLIVHPYDEYCQRRLIMTMPNGDEYDLIVAWYSFMTRCYQPAFEFTKTNDEGSSFSLRFYFNDLDSPNPAKMGREDTYIFIKFIEELSKHYSTKKGFYDKHY